MTDDEPIGTITVGGRETFIYGMERLVVDGRECVDIRTAAGRTRYVGVKLDHVAFGPDGGAEARLTPDGGWPCR